MVFLFSRQLMNITLCRSQNVDAINLPADCKLIWLRNVAVDPYFIHCHIPHEKVLFIWVKQLKQSSESSINCWFCPTVSKRGIHFKQNFGIPKFWYKLWCIFYDIFMIYIFTISAISCTFTLRLFKMTSWISLMFSGITASFGLPEPFSIICVRTSNFELGRPETNGCVRRGRILNFSSHS